jgi:hypothetical protein
MNNKYKIDILVLCFELAKWRDDEWKNGDRRKAQRIQKVIDRHMLMKDKG